MGDTSQGSQPQSDLYTVLLGVATVFVLIATIVMSIRAQQFFGQWIPLGGA